MANTAKASDFVVCGGNADLQYEVMIGQTTITIIKIRLINFKEETINE